GWWLGTASARPFLTDSFAEPVREMVEVLLTLMDGLGIAAQEGRDILDAAMPELGGLDGRISPAVLLRERVVEHPHRMLDLGAVRHEGRPWRGPVCPCYGYTAGATDREVIESAILSGRGLPEASLPGVGPWR